MYALAALGCVFNWGDGLFRVLLKRQRADQFVAELLHGRL
jgi:hypothetical protein